MIRLTKLNKNKLKKKSQIDLLECLLDIFTHHAVKEKKLWKLVTHFTFQTFFLNLKIMKLDIKYGEKIDIESNRENNIIHYDQVKAETFLDKKDLPPLDSFNFNNNSYANQL